MNGFDPGRLFWAGFPGRSIPGNLIRRLEAGAIGGIILFARNFSSEEELLALAQELHARWRGPGRLLLGVDQEGGRVARIRSVKWPSAFELAGAGDPGFTRQTARLMARELAHFGFNTDFAPVLDVWTRPENRVIGNRAFGSNPEAVILHAGAFAQGLRDEGIFTCGKHFPGHGDTIADSHERLPVCELQMELIENIHEKPFRMLADVLDFIMTAHIVAPARDGRFPATLSAAWVSRARGLPFSGILVSDDLEMGALRDFQDRLAVRALDAGLDMLMVCASQEFLETCIDDVKSAMMGDFARQGAMQARIRRLESLNLRASSLRPLKDRKAWNHEVRSTLSRLHPQD